MDRVVSLWKQWRARVRLKPLTKQEARPEKQKDAKFPVLNVSEFNTDLANLSKTASRTSPLSLLVMDVDKFKSINDCLGGGHEGGDRALMALSELLIRVAQSKGTAYRWGGDEFCVLLENHSLGEAEVVAERIRREVRDLKVDGLPDGFSTSIGVATCPESIENSSELFAFSDKAMYEAKRAGGNCVTKSGTLSSGSALTVPGKPKQPKEEIKRQLTAFLKEGKAIQNGIAYNNQESLREKAAWEKRVEEYLSANLDDSYAVQFQIPSREANEHPRGIMLGMLPAWRELTSRMWMLSDFISKLRS
jgi:diguanylate cyclase (GGDEF)-like protein